MNRTTWLLLGFFLLAGAALWYIKQDEPAKSATTVLSEDRAFKVEDPETIHKIFIAKRNGETITLEREKDYWLYNGAHRALPTAVENVMRAVTEVQMKFIPPNAAVPTMVKDLSSQGIKVELYNENGDKLKAYYIGGATPDERGTYMIMEGSDQPYVAHLPTWGGNLRFRFTLIGDEWRDKSIFAVPMKTIERISVEYPKQQNNSFVIEKSGNRFEVNPFYAFTPKIEMPASPSLLDSYLSSYERIGAETFKNKFPKRDSVLQTIPFAKIELRTTTGEIQTANFYPIYLDQANIDVQTGRKIADNTVRRYFVWLNEEDFMLVQHRVFEQLFWGYDFFFDERNIK